MPGRREPPGIFFLQSREIPMKSTKSSNEASRSSGSRGSADSGTKKASNAHAAQRQSEKSMANKERSRHTSATAGDKSSK
jgi:hypothetical protein